MLELGCGDGANVLSLAQAFPQSTFIGLDASAAAIERGKQLAQRAQMANIDLRQAVLEELPEDLGQFDYIISHGVYSWIAPQARTALLECCKERLAEHGIAYISYNAYPGSHLRDMTREILRYHVRDTDDPAVRLERAQQLMQTIVAIEDPSPYARALREQMERMLNYSQALLFHDDLAEISTPFYFYEFVDHAASHGLQFLSEADLAESRMEGVPASAIDLFKAVADDPLAREQYMDFFKNRTFRRTLLCHAEVSVDRSIDDLLLERLAICSSAQVSSDEKNQDGETYVTPEGYSVRTSEPLVLAALAELARTWPGALAFDTLLERSLDAVQISASEAADRLRAVMLEAYLAHVVQLLSTAPPITSRVEELPLASSLARAQCAAGLSVVSSLSHSNARLENDLETKLLASLDGTRGLSELSRQLDQPEGEVAGALQRFASLGLLESQV